MNKFTYGSVCSGIESVSCAWHDFAACEWLSEIEAFPSAVLAHHYPTVPNLGDMTKIKDKILSGEIDAPDVLVGGTPCQAFSVAGERKSLDDERGQLTLAFIELADAIDEVRAKNGKQPTIILWENVPGVLSTKDNAFGCLLGGLARADSELQPSGKKWGNFGFIGGQREVAWRVLDSQHFGVPQRRKRVFVVASARKLSVGGVLFEHKKHMEPSEKRGEIGGFGAGSSFEKVARESDGLVIYNNGSMGGVLKPTFPFPTLTTKSGANEGALIEHKDWARRLTSVECERLQGFPDNYTLIEVKGRPASHAARAKAVGNSMTVQVMRWIGKRIGNFIES